MNCREYQHQIVLFLYEELPDAEWAGLQAHLDECSACRETLDEHKGLHLALNDEARNWEAPSDLLMESRRSLADELDRIERKRPWWQIPTFSVVFTPMRLLESAALVAMGLALGVYVGKLQAPASFVTSTTSEPSAISVIPKDATVSNLRVVDANDATGDVELDGEAVKPFHLKGNMNDETVRKLTLSALSSANSHSRLHAVQALSKSPADDAVKEALIDLLGGDDNPTVRRWALQGLIPFTGEPNVQDAVKQAMKSDRDQGIRVLALDALTRSTDESVFKSIEDLKDDPSPYIRAKGLQFIGNHQ
jgi:hypothetical protein